MAGRQQLYTSAGSCTHVHTPFPPPRIQPSIQEAHWLRFVNTSSKTDIETSSNNIDFQKIVKNYQSCIELENVLI